MPGTLSSRANLTITGNKQVERFFNVLEKEITSDFLFCGVKQRDYLLVRSFFNTKKSLLSLDIQAQRLAIKKSMHKSNYLDPDSVTLNIRTYGELEKNWV